MAIEINRAWTVTGSGADYAGTNTVGTCNTSNLADNMKHTAYRAVRSLYWSGLWDWTDSSVTNEVRDLSRQAVNRANNMIDHSFCWAGLGAESALSNLKYINYIGYRINTEAERVEYRDNNNNTPWSFDIYLNYEPDESWSNLTYPLSNWRNSRNTYAKRYGFKNYNNTADPNNQIDFWGYRGDSYCSCNLYPIHKIALRNWINLIVVLAKPTIQSDRTTIRAFDLRTYCDSAHENYPIVIRVLLVPFMYSNSYQNYRTVTMSTGRNDRPHLSLTLYKQPSYAGKHIFTSGDDYDNIMWESVWRSGLIAPPDSTGRSNSNFDDLQFRGNDNNDHNVAMTNYIMIMGMLTGCGNVSYGSGNISWGANYAEANLYALRFEDTLLIECGTDKWKEEVFTTNTDWLCFYREFDDTFEEECKKQTACFGMFFTDRYSVAYNGELYDENMYLGTLDNNNIGHGLYTKGILNATQKQWEWTDSSDADYNPEYDPEPSDTNNYDNNSEFNSPSIPKGLFKYYVLNTAGVENFKNELWKAFDLKPQDIDYTEFAKDQFLTNEPLDLVVSLKKYPMLLSQASAPEAVTIGKYVTNVQANELVSSFTFIDLGTVTINTHFGGNFLDYDYTQLALYVPFCGVVSLDTSIYMGKQCRVYMSIDYTSGSCTAYIMCGTDLGWLVTNALNGQIAVDLPLSGIQAKTLEQNLASAKSAVTKSGVVGAGKTLAGIGMAVAGAVTGGVPLVLGGLGSITSGINDVNKSVKQEYELHNTQIPIDQIGSLTALNAWTGELKPRLIIYRPITSMYVDTPNLATPIESRMQAYGHSEGFAVVEVGTINSLGISGYAEFTNIDLSGIVATEEVKRDIISQLINGVYV